MGKVYVDGTQVGTFDPDIEGTSGNILVDGEAVGTFTLADVGDVFLDSEKVGMYCSKGNCHIPRTKAVFGSASFEPAEGDIIETDLHLGCTREVSSFRLLLQNWDKKYSPGEVNAINVGDEAQIFLGRGAYAPLLLTGCVEAIEPQSTPSSHYISINGRCLGEKLFRPVVTKEYASQKGEAVIKDLMDSFAGISHSRSGVELIEDTDTTFTLLQYDDSPLADVLKFIAKASDKSGVIGYDWRLEYDGKFAFFPQNTKSSLVSLTDAIERAKYAKDIQRIRNRITVYGTRGKCYPQDHDQYTEQNDSETPGADGWGLDGTRSWNADALVGNESMQVAITGVSSFYVQNTLPDVESIDCSAYKNKSYNNLHVAIKIVSAPNPDGETIIQVRVDAPDAANCFTYWLTTLKYLEIPREGEWFEHDIPLGSVTERWTKSGNADWSNVQKITFYIWGINTGDFTVRFDNFYFSGMRFHHTEEDPTSIKYPRDIVEVDEELYSDGECELHAKALLAYLKEPREAIEIISSILDYGSDRLQAGDKIPVVLPNENVNSTFRIDSVDLFARARDQSLTIILHLGKQKPLLADYLYGLKSEGTTLEKVARTKSGD